MKPSSSRVSHIVLAALIIGVMLASSVVEAQRGGPRRGGSMQGPPHGHGPAPGNPSAPAHGGGAVGPGNPGSQPPASQPGTGRPGHGHPGAGRGGPARGGNADAAHAADMKAIQFLLINRAKIRRTVVNRPDGVETLTESDDPNVTAVLVWHVESMGLRVKEQRPIHVRDPLFAEMFRNAATLNMKVERTAQGVKVVETSTNAYSVKLIQAHAQVVSLFLENGPIEVRKNHAVPK
jgi:hypothetical protein